ncbi:hypothetical protein Tco_1381774, partial [Tanacetum coccineum]
MTLHQYTCGVLDGLQSLLLLSGDLPLLHRPVKTEMIFQDWVRSFELSFALLPFVVTESLELLEQFLVVLLAEFLEIYSGCSSRRALRGLFVFPCRIPHIGLGMARGRLFVIAHAGVGPLSGKSPRVIVYANVSILPQSMFVRGGATGAAFK